MAKGRDRQVTDADRAALERFAAAIKETEARDRVKKVEQRRQSSARDELTAAKRELDMAIGRVRAAQGTEATAVANQEWRAAKARVLELETGAAPSWAPVVPVSDAPDAAPVAGPPSEADSNEPEQFEQLTDGAAEDTAAVHPAGDAG